MPELPEVEVLVRHLRPALTGRRLRSARVHREKVLRPHTAAALQSHVEGCVITQVERRAKYIVVRLRRGTAREHDDLIVHLGMTGRLYLLPKAQPLPRHVVAEFDLGRTRLVFEDMRLFGRLALGTDVLQGLGPEPLDPEFSVARLTVALQSSQPIKPRLLDQAAIAGIGNIYASEALFRARIHPATPARTLSAPQLRRLHKAIRQTLDEAIRFGSTVPLNWDGQGTQDGLFYYGSDPESAGAYEERLRVYDREGSPCLRCRTPIRRLTQAGRSTFFCPMCQGR